MESLFTNVEQTSSTQQVSATTGTIETTHAYPDDQTVTSGIKPFIVVHR